MARQTYTSGQTLTAAQMTQLQNSVWSDDVNAQTGTSYTLVLADAGKQVTMTNASASTLTVPPNSSIAFDVGVRIQVIQLGAGAVTLTAGAGVTLNKNDASATMVQHGVATLIKIGTDVWVAKVGAPGLQTSSVTTAFLQDDSVTQVKLADRAVGSAELDNLTLNAQTGTSYTLVLTDAQKLVTQSNASAITTTIPPNSSVAFEVGDQVNLLQLGAGQVTVAAGAGVTIRSEGSKLKLKGQYAAATVVKIDTDEWVAIGNLSA